MVTKYGVVGMRLYYTLFKSNLRKRKIFSLSIFLLSILVTIVGGTVLSALNMNDLVYDKIYKKTGSPDLLICFSGIAYQDAYYNELSNMNDVVDINVVHEIYTTIKDKENADVMVLIESNTETGLEINSGEIYLSNYFDNMSKFAVGEKLDITINSYSKEFVIAGFYEDPIFGSSIMKYNQFVISAEDYDNIINSGALTEADEKYLMFVDWSDLVESSDLPTVITEKMNDFSGALAAEFMYDKLYIKKAYTMIPNIVSIVLLLATVFIACGAFYVLRYSLLTTIEADYKEIGILKALGMKYHQIKVIYATFYLIIVLIGIIIGYIVSCFFARQVAQIYLSLNGLNGTEEFFRGGNYLGFVVPIGFFLISFLIVWIDFSKVKNISPIQAISGRKKASIKKLLKFDITKVTKMPFSIRMSLKQFLSKTNQYVSLIIITILFSFLMFSVWALNNSFHEKEEVYSLLGLPRNDIVLRSNDDDKMDYLESEIKTQYNINFYQSFTQTTLRIDNNNAVALIYGEIPDTITIIEGVAPENSNEILLATSLRNTLGKNVGDTVELKSSGGNVEKFVITGLYQTVNNLGVELCMLQSGYEHINNGELILQKVIQLEEPQLIEDVVLAYEENTYGVSVVNGRSSSEGLIGTIQSSLKMMATAILIIAMALSSLVCFLLTLVSIGKEDYELRIFRLIGFKIRQLRVQYALRILVATLLAFLIGWIIYICLSSYMFNAIILMAGLSNISVGLSFKECMFILSLFVIMNGIISWIATRKILHYKYIKE